MQETSNREEASSCPQAPAIRVKARQAEVRIVMTRDADGNALNRTHRRRFLLSCLLECGVCRGNGERLEFGKGDVGRVRSVRLKSPDSEEDIAKRLIAVEKIV
jgi:hypothetical protein